MPKLAFPVLALCALSSCVAADRTADLTAEEVFSAVEARYANAYNVTWSSDLDNVGTVKTVRAEFSFEGSDKFRIAFKSRDEKEGKDVAGVLQSDGVSAFLITGDPGERTDFSVRGDTGRILRRFFARTGMSLFVRAGYASFNDLMQLEDVTRKFPIRDLRFGLDTLVQGRETRMIEYTLDMHPPGIALKMSLWIDRRTLAILRRESTDEGGGTLFERTLDTVFD